MNIKHKYTENTCNTMAFGTINMLIDFNERIITKFNCIINN